MAELIEPEKVQKTTALVALAAVIAAPLYWLDGRLGLSASILLSLAVVQQLAAEGSKQRSAEYGPRFLGGFFTGPNEGTAKLECVFEDTVNAGASRYDEYFNKKPEV